MHITFCFIVGLSCDNQVARHIAANFSFMNKQSISKLIITL